MDNYNDVTPNDEIETLDTTPEVLDELEVKHNDVLDDDRVETLGEDEVEILGDEDDLPKEEEKTEKPLSEETSKDSESKKKRSFLANGLMLIFIVVALFGLVFYFTVYEKTALMQKAFNTSMTSFRRNINAMIDDLPNINYKKGYTTIAVKTDTPGIKNLKYDLAFNLDKGEAYVMNQDKTGFYAKNDILYYLLNDQIFSKKLEKSIKEYSKENIDSQKANKDNLKTNTKLMEYAQKAINNKFDKSKVTEKKVTYEFGRACKGLSNCHKQIKSLRKLTYQLNPDNLYQMKEEFVRLVEKDKDLVNKIGKDKFKKFKEEVKDSKMEVDREKTKYISIYMDFLDAKVIEIKEDDTLRYENHKGIISLYHVALEDKKEVLTGDSFSFDKDNTGNFIYKRDNEEIVKGTYKLTKDDKKDIKLEKTKTNGKLDLNIDLVILGQKLNVNIAYDSLKDVPNIDLTKAKPVKEMTKDEENNLKESFGIIYNFLPEK